MRRWRRSSFPCFWALGRKGKTTYKAMDICQRWDFSNIFLDFFFTA